MAGGGQPDDGLRQVRRVGRVAELVRGDLERAVLFRAGQDLGDEIIPARPEEPRHAADVEAAAGEVAHDLLARGLAPRVDAGRVDRVPLPVEIAAAAVENLVGADVEQRRARLRRGQRDVLRAHRVDAKGQVGVGLAAIHVGVRRGVYDQIGPEAGDAVADRRRGDVILGHVQPEDLVPGERRLELAAKLALMAGDDNTHGFVLPKDRSGDLTAETRERAQRGSNLRRLSRVLGTSSQ